MKRASPKPRKGKREEPSLLRLPSQLARELCPPRPGSPHTPDTVVEQLDYFAAGEPDPRCARCHPHLAIPPHARSPLPDGQPVGLAPDQKRDELAREVWRCLEPSYPPIPPQVEDFQKVLENAIQDDVLTHEVIASLLASDRELEPETREYIAHYIINEWDRRWRSKKSRNTGGASLLSPSSM